MRYARIAAFALLISVKRQADVKAAQMQTIKQILDRIRWDPEFGRGEFELGYYDRVVRRVLRIPLREVAPDEAGFFAFVDDNGERRSVPLHRIKELYKDGELIWLRDPLRRDSEATHRPSTLTGKPLERGRWAAIKRRSHWTND